MAAESAMRHLNDEFVVYWQGLGYVVNERARLIFEDLVETNFDVEQTAARLGRLDSPLRVSVQDIHQIAGAVQRRTGRKSLALQTTVIPPAAVDHLTKHFRQCFHRRPAIILSFLSIAASALWWLHDSPDIAASFASPAHVTGSVFLILLSLVLHEIGHSSALAYYGERPGRIGFGFYLVFPAFFADVSRAWSLPRYQRAVVDIAGIFFQLAVNACFISLSLLFELDWMAFPIIFNFYLIFYALNPVFKFDGRWLFTDLLGLETQEALESELLSGLKNYRRRDRKTRFAIACAITFYVAFLAFLFASISYALSRAAVAISGAHDFSDVLLPVLLSMFLSTVGVLLVIQTIVGFRRPIKPHPG